MDPYKIKTISQYHQVLGIAKPEHPLVSVISLDEFKPPAGNSRISVVFDFYIISLKRNLEGTINYTYGQQAYDFDDGVMFFIAPKQVFSFDADQDLKAPAGCCWCIRIFSGGHLWQKQSNNMISLAMQQMRPCFCLRKRKQQLQALLS
ncbi:MAG: hypothetical protein ACXVJD_03010 [Mucilaginibacter sp.]